MDVPEKQWIAAVSTTVANTLVEFRQQIQDQVEMLAVDCHPWNGTLTLAMLTRSEVESDPLLADPAEMATWKHYNFGRFTAAWKAASELGLRMREVYEQSGSCYATTADSFLVACAKAMTEETVQQAIVSFNRSDKFRISVCHPDTEQEYYPCRS